MSWDDELEDLARRRGPALVGYAYLLTGDLHTAQDVVQEALVRTFVRHRGGARVESLELYVRRVVLNVYRDQYRRRAVWRGVRHLVAEPASYGAPDAAAVDHLDLHAALGQLSPRERACVVLHHYEDLSVGEVAEWLGLSTGTVKRYLADGRARLVPLLAPDDDTGRGDDTRCRDGHADVITERSGRRASTRDWRTSPAGQRPYMPRPRGSRPHA